MKHISISINVPINLTTTRTGYHISLLREEGGSGLPGKVEQNFKSAPQSKIFNIC